MGLFDDVARFGSKVAGDIGSGVITGAGVITGQLSPFDAPSAFKQTRRIARPTSGILTEAALDEFEEPRYVPEPIVDAARVPRAAVDVTGSAINLAGSAADSARTVGGIADTLADANDKLGGYLIPVALAVGGYVLLKR